MTLPSGYNQTNDGLVAKSDHDALKARVTNLETASPTSAHTHSAADITSGTFNIGRIPTGTTSSTVAVGNHTHAVASAATEGFMSAADKSKLDTLSGKQRNALINPTASPTSSVTDVVFVSMTVPASQLAAGVFLKGEMWGQFAQGTAGGNLELWARVNGVRVNIVVSSLGTTASSANLMLLKVLLTVRAIGTTAGIAVNGRARVKSTDSHMGDNQVVSTNTTADVLVELGGTFTVADAAHTMTARQAVLWVV